MKLVFDDNVEFDVSPWRLTGVQVTLTRFPQEPEDRKRAVTSVLQPDEVGTLVAALTGVLKQQQKAGK